MEAVFQNREMQADAFTKLGTERRKQLLQSLGRWL